MKKLFKYSWYDVTETERDNDPNAFYNTANDAIFGEDYDLIDYYRDNAGIELEYCGKGMADYTYTDADGVARIVHIVSIDDVTNN